ncbi:RagB/SusD family nutrient uptake outer membrane protein [Chitinophaga caseinilytica]|uniref:RagB/SusD family nutrient uptake outer membrane protein n=1 Tax=Chitinophaga caseinilytica TaxID=2267521 RepID=UPI003C2C9280
MKRRTYQLAYILLAVALLGTGCLGDLGIKPQDRVPQQGAFNNVTALNTGVLGVYAGLNYGATQYITTLLTDEATMPRENNTGRGVIPWRWQYDPGTSAEPAAAWGAYYDVIDRANRVLAVIDQVPATGEELITRNRLKAELLALRAFSHLELLSYYSVDYEPASPGVPVMTESKLSKPPRDAVSKVYQQINADLVAAKGLFPANYVVTNRQRIDPLIVTAIQARASLLQKNYDAAINFATQVIDARPLASAAAFPNIWTDLSTAEVIWKLKRDNGEERLGVNYRDNTGRIIWAPSFKLMESFDPVNDIRFANYFRNLGTVDAPRWTAIKFVGGQAALVNLADAKLFRTAEMYLIRAEANARKATPNVVAGAADLNALRTARITGYVPEIFPTAAALLDAVIQERFKELAFEAARYVDLRRNNRQINRGPKDVALAQDAVNLTQDDREYWLPIPQAEIFANENIAQHPKWQQ